MNDTNHDERRFEEALAWHVALKHDDADWDTYIAWLDSDPRNREAFDEVALLEMAISRHAAALLATSATEDLEAWQNEQEELSFGAPTRRYGRWLGGAAAIAASLVAAVVLAPQLKSNTTYTTGSGQTQQIALREGIVVDLGPGSRLVAYRGDVNRLELVTGNAFFSVRHDPSRPLSIEVADRTIHDIGTRFDVAVAGQALAVAVAEGNVTVADQDGQERETVSAGKQYVLGTDGKARVTPVQRDAVGAWRRGELHYADVPFSLVAADLERYTRRKVTLDPALRNRTFSGILVIGDGSKAFGDVAALAGIDYSEKNGTVHFGSASRR